MFYIGGALAVLFIAAFSKTHLQMLLGFLGAIGYLLLGFMMTEQLSSNLRRSRGSDKKLIMAINLASFGAAYWALSSYMGNYIAPSILVGPGFLIGIWRVFR